MEKQVTSFLDYLQNDKKFSINTLQSYRRDILQYKKYIEENNMNYSKIKTDDIKEYMKYIESINKKASTISRNLA